MLRLSNNRIMAGMCVSVFRGPFSPGYAARRRFTSGQLVKAIRVWENASCSVWAKCPLYPLGKWHVTASNTFWQTIEIRVNR